MTKLPSRLLTGIALAAMCAVTLPAAARENRGPIVLVSGDLSDPFFGAIKRGADDAAKNLGVEYTYLASNISGADLAKALEAAAATNPAGVAFGDWFPEAQDPIVKGDSKPICLNGLWGKCKAESWSIGLLLRITNPGVLG